MVSVNVIPVGKYSRDAYVDVQNLVGVFNSIMARDGWLFGASDSRQYGRLGGGGIDRPDSLVTSARPAMARAGRLR